MIDRYADPECQAILADLQSLCSRVKAVSDRLDKVGPVGILWGVLHPLYDALSSAEAELLPEGHGDAPQAPQ